ncbi:MAG: hypothetical protein ACI88C_002518 [Acidimicrobiales bacterium]
MSSSYCSLRPFVARHLAEVILPSCPQLLETA